MTIELTNILIAMAAGAGYGLIWYARARQQGESFKPHKFAATLLVAMGVGAGLGLAGEQVTQQSIETQLAIYAGTITVVEGLIKLLYEYLK